MSNEKDFHDGYNAGFVDAQRELQAERVAHQRELSSLGDEIERLKKKLQIFQKHSLSLTDLTKLAKLKS